MQTFNIPSNDASLGTLSVSAIGELMKNQAPASIVSPQHKMKVLQDINGEPMIFTIGNDNIFYVYLRSNDSSTGWVVYDLSSSLLANSMATTFEASQGTAGNIQLAIGICPVGQPQQGQFYITTYLSNDTTQIDWANFGNQWVARPFNGEPNFTDIVIGGYDNTTPLGIAVVQNNGSEQRFQFNTNASDSTWNWEAYKLPENATNIIEVAVGKISNRWGSYVLYDTASGRSLSFTSLPDDYGSTHNYSFVAPATINTIQAIVGTDMYNYDLYAAGDGIYLFEHSHTSAPKVVTSSDVSSGIHQMVAVTDGQNITLWTVYGDEILQYIEGDNNHINWQTPIPMDTGVAQIAAMRSRTKYSNVIFMVNANNTLAYLYQDAVSSIWRDTQIQLPDLEKNVTFTSYSTQISIQDQFGQNVLKPLNITASNWMYVTINGESHSLDAENPVSVTPDSMGKITIIFSTKSLGTAIFRLNSDYFTTQININPGQKIMAGLATIQTGDDLKNITLSDGSPLIPPNSIDDDTLNSAAQALYSLTSTSQGFPEDGSTVSATTNSQTTNFAVTTPSMKTLAFQRKGNSLVCLQGQDAEAIYAQLMSYNTHNTLQLNVIDTIKIGVGDFVSWVASGIEAVGDWVLNVVEETVQFVITIGEKVVQVVVEALEEAFEMLNWLLEEILGIDLEKILKWLGFIFDWNDIVVTHNVFKNMVNQTMNMSYDQVDVLALEVSAWFDSLKQKVSALQTYDTSSIPSTPVKESGVDAQAQVPESADSNSSFNYSPASNWGTYHLQHSQTLSSTSATANEFNVFLAASQNPVSQFYNDILLPACQSIEASLQQIAQDLIKGFTDNTLTFTDVLKQLAGDLIIGILDAIETIVVGFLAFAKDLLSDFQTLINKTIKIPFFSFVYKEITGNDMSILDMLALIASIPATICYKIMTGNAPFADSTYNFLSTDYRTVFEGSGMPMPTQTVNFSASLSNASSQPQVSDGWKKYSQIGAIGFEISYLTCVGLSLFKSIEKINLKINNEKGPSMGPINATILVASLISSACSFPVGYDDEVIYQRIAWTTNLGATLINTALSKAKDSEPVIGVITGAKGVLIMAMNIITVYDEYSSPTTQSTNADQSATENLMNAIKTLQNCANFVGTLGNAAADILPDEMVVSKTTSLAVCAGGTVVGALCNITRFSANVINKLEHQNY
jgi:hypothetical protein